MRLANKGILRMQSFPLSKRPVEPTFAPTGMGSFDPVAVRFANRYYAQDDMSFLIEVQSPYNRSGAFASDN